MELVGVHNFQKNDDGYYRFQAIASSNRYDVQGQKFDIPSLEFACKYPLLLIEHEFESFLPVGNATDFKKHIVDNKQYASFTGIIDKHARPDVVEMIKTEYYKAVSIGGGSQVGLGSDGVIYDGRIKEISLVRTPANRDAMIFQKASKISADLFFGMSESEIAISLQKVFTKSMSLILLKFIMSGFDDISRWDIGMLKWLKDAYDA